jgi:tRNA (cmo5U34)-methyltransferase
MDLSQKSSVAEIRTRFDQDVERFSNLATGQTATIDSAYCMDLVARAATAAAPADLRVLDLGCGAGNYSLKIQEYRPQARFTLVDLSRPMLDRARARLGASVQAGLQEDIRDLPFAAGSFDTIVAAAVLHHLRTPGEWSAVFGALFRWLKPGGSVWIFDLVTHEDPAIQALLWQEYARYLEGMGGPSYREKVFAYIEQEDTPVPLNYQLGLLRKAGFVHAEVLHKHACFAAFGGRKSAN